MQAPYLLFSLVLPFLGSLILVSSAPLSSSSNSSSNPVLPEAQMNRSLTIFRGYIDALAQRVEKMRKAIERSLMPECRYPWKVVADDLCLFKPPFKRAWLAAMYFCSSIGGHLATLQNGAEWTAVQMLDLHTGLCPWIGLHYDVRKKDFAWVSGSNATYRKWEIGEPDRDDFYNRNVTANCVYACPTGMGDHDCGYQNEFVCEKRPRMKEFFARDKN